jgi:hypothetical protein
MPKLMTDASIDMVGMLRFITHFTIRMCLFHTSLFPLTWLGSFLDAAAEDQHVDARFEVHVQLALQNNASFWSSPDRI